MSKGRRIAQESRTNGACRSRLEAEWKWGHLASDDPRRPLGSHPLVTTDTNQRDDNWARSNGRRRPAEMCWRGVGSPEAGHYQRKHERFSREFSLRTPKRQGSKSVVPDFQNFYLACQDGWRPKEPLVAHAIYKSLGIHAERLKNSV